MSRQASCGGHGILEIRNATRILEQSRIPCCIIGVSALIFYGVPRVRDKWEICIAPEKIEEAIRILGQQQEYVQTNEKQIPQPMSLAHTYTWFRGNTVDYTFCLVPSTHARIAVGQIAACRSPHGVPYAPLKDLVQSYLDMNDTVSLCDIVDGVNLSYGWGETHLDLNGTTDVDWAQKRNAELMGGEGMFEPSVLGSAFPTAQVGKKLLWCKTTEEKEQRLAQMLVPDGLFETRYKLKGFSSEPWRKQRDLF